jgi:hypothetical protein
VPPHRFTRHFALTGIAAILGAVGVGALMHLQGPSALLDPKRHTISAYALQDNGWQFNAAVLVLAAGSLAALAALVGARVVSATSGAAIGLALWSASLAAVVYFPKHNWAAGPSIEGDLHRVASVVAFLSLPVAALLAARGGLRHEPWRGHARWTLAFGVLSLLWFTPIVGAILLEPFTGVRWWRAIPLGAVERALVVSEIVTLLALGWWAIRAHRAPTAPTAQGPDKSPTAAPHTSPMPYRAQTAHRAHVARAAQPAEACAPDKSPRESSDLRSA